MHQFYQMLPRVESTPWRGPRGQRRSSAGRRRGLGRGEGEVQATEGRPDRGEHRAACAWTRGPGSVREEGAKDFR